MHHRTEKMKILTTELMMKAAGCQELSKCLSLNMSDKDLMEVNVEAISALTGVHTLDLSNNNLTSFPNIRLRKLKTLDLSGNQLDNVDFLTNFPNLETLFIDGNPRFGAMEEIMAILLCPSLRSVNEVPYARLQKTLDNFKNKWIIQMNAKFDVMMTKQFSDGLPFEAVDCAIAEFQADMQKDPLFATATDREMRVLKKLAVGVVEKARVAEHRSYSTPCTPDTPKSARISNRIKTGASPMSFSKYRRLSGHTEILKNPITIKNGIISSSNKKRKREDSPQSDDCIVSKRGKITSPLSVRNNLNSPNNKKRKRNNSPGTEKSSKKGRMLSPSPTKFSSLRLENFTSMTLPTIPDYDPVFFIRCHSNDNDPNDTETKIWKCAMEPKQNNSGETTDILATCGGLMVCLIDCKTGKVMKRFKDTNKDECFYTLAWTTISLNAEKQDTTNILAVAGQRGDIKLIQPSQFVMYATLEGHRNYISCLTFHPRHPTILFSGSRDGKIIMWDIGIPDLKDYSVNFKKLHVLQTPDTDALNLVISQPSNTLLAGCENSCYGWKIDNLKKVTREPNFQITLPSYKEDIENGKAKKASLQSVDGLVALSNGFVASKCVGDDRISVWNVKDTLSKRGRNLFVTPTAVLSYVKSEVDYINMASTKDILTVGDDHGSLYMYGIEKLTERTANRKSVIMENTQVLEWPDVDTSKIYSAKTDEDNYKPENIVINSTCISSNEEFLVCGTDNNLVCIWKMSSIC